MENRSRFFRKKKHAHTHMHTHICTHTYAHAHAHAHTHPHPHPHPHPHTHTHMKRLNFIKNEILLTLTGYEKVLGKMPDIEIKVRLTLLSPVNPSRPNPGRRVKIKLNFYFRTSLWCLKRFHENLKGLHKTF